MVGHTCGQVTAKRVLHPFRLEFYDDPQTGAEPVREWMLNELTPYQRRALGVALFQVLQRHGVDVCNGEYGKQLGQGLFEFRLRHDADEIIAIHTDQAPEGVVGEGRILLRIFCHSFGDRIILLLGGYDKAASPSARRQTKEVELARKRLREFRARPSI